MQAEVQISLSVFQIMSALFCHEKDLALANPFSFNERRKDLFDKHSLIALKKSPDFDKSKIIPASPTTSHNAPPFATTTGVPLAIASSAGKPKPSSNEGNTNNNAPA